ncbi:hypothetical protein DUZ99_06335 [Xylanibacillus composti]|nr:hypothetical protein [Xylanibacillus composti]
MFFQQMVYGRSVGEGRVRRSFRSSDAWQSRAYPADGNSAGATGSWIFQGLPLMRRKSLPLGA